MRPNDKYQVTIRGPLPANVGARVAEAHAEAIRARAKHQEGQPKPTA